MNPRLGEIQIIQTSNFFYRRGVLAYELVLELQTELQGMWFNSLPSEKEDCCQVS